MRRERVTAAETPQQVTILARQILTNPATAHTFFQAADMLQPGATVLVVVQPVGWVGEWHENPKPQWIVPLSGRWFVETMDGERVEMGPGEVSFGGDQNTKPDAQGRKGHRSGTVGDQPSVNLIVQLEKDPFVR